MKALVFNSSPLMHKGNTALILTPFIEGMQEAGAEVELFYTKKLDINPCQGERNCWFRTPCKCFQDDDMQWLLPKLHEADIWVFATPVYVDGITGRMKNLIDRLIPLIEPYFELREGHCRHVVLEGHKYGKVVLVSNCGFWEMDNFDPLLVHMEAMCKNMAKDYAGAVLRPHGEAMKPMMKMGISLDDIFEAAREAGRQLVRDGEMSTATLDIVGRELLPLEMYVERLNQNFQQILDR
jgi:multimeric flavodoxin WrbA